MLTEKLEEVSRQFDAVVELANTEDERRGRAVELLDQLRELLSSAAPSSSLADAVRSVGEVTSDVPPHPVAAAPASRRAPAPLPPDGVAKSEMRILNALAWLEAIGVRQPERTAVAFLADYSPGSGNWNNLCGKLRGRGLIEYAGGDHMILSAGGRAIAQRPTVPPTNAELHQAVKAKLGGGEGRLLDVLLKSYPKALTAQDLATKAGFAPGSGNFNNLRGRLKTLGLVDYPAQGMVVAKSLLFPESAKR